MGQSTNLYLNPRFRTTEILEVIRRLYGETKIRTYDTVPDMISIDIVPLGRSIYCHFNVSTPIGTSTLLSLGANEQGQNILRDIANCLGGLFQPTDYEETMEMIQGNLSYDNAMPYFVQYAIIHDGIHPADVQGILKSRQNWYQQIEHEKVGLTETLKRDMEVM